MQIFNIDKDKFIAYENDVATVYSKEELARRKEHAQYNIDMIGENLKDAKILSTTKLTEEVKELVVERNRLIEEEKQRFVEEQRGFTDEIKKIDDLLN